MPTFDNENQVKYSKENRPFVSVSKAASCSRSFAGDRHCCEASIDARNWTFLGRGWITDHQEARRRGVQHIVVTHAMAPEIGMTIPQMQQAARDGAYIEFVYSRHARTER